MDYQDRMSRWIKVSIGMMRFEPDMMTLVQSLGRIDVSLIARDFQITEAYKRIGQEVQNDEAVQDHLTHSYLWVLGAYEAIRTLTQYMREGRDNVPGEVIERFREVRAKFARLRMPLAKMQPATAHADTDSHIAFPGLDTGLGIAWRVNESLFISRRELSDALLEALEFARVMKLRQQVEPSNNSLKVDGPDGPQP